VLQRHGVLHCRCDCVYEDDQLSGRMQIDSGRGWAAMETAKSWLDFFRISFLSPG